ncbi:MAG: hypothetical protein ACK5HY_09790 [Parahaliea sp.]
MTSPLSRLAVALGALYLGIPCLAWGADADAPIIPRYVAAPPATEDMLALRGTRWVIGSAVSIGDEAVPGLYAISNSPPHLAQLAPNPRPLPAHSRCPAPLEAAAFSPLGMDLRMLENSRELVVINRGGRHAVERFDLAIVDGVPALAWRDCVPLPEHISANAVAVLATGELYVTQQFDPRDARSWEKRVRGEPTGQVFRWTPQQDWSAATATALSTPNGLVVTEDGCRAFVAAWSSRQLVRQALPCEGGEEGGENAPDQVLDLPFMPDNLRWSAAGTLLVTGQDTTPPRLLECVREGRHCPERLNVMEIDPDSLAVLQRWQLTGDPDLSLGTTAIDVGDEIWVSSILGRRIGRYARDHQPPDTGE